MQGLSSGWIPTSMGVPNGEGFLGRLSLPFLRLVTNPWVYSEPATAMQAWGWIQH